MRKKMGESQKKVRQQCVSNKEKDEKKSNIREDAEQVDPSNPEPDQTKSNNHESLENKSQDNKSLPKHFCFFKYFGPASRIGCENIDGENSKLTSCYFKSAIKEGCKSLDGFYACVNHIQQPEDHRIVFSTAYLGASSFLEAIKEEINTREPRHCRKLSMCYKDNDDFMELLSDTLSDDLSDKLICYLKNCTLSKKATAKSGDNDFNIFLIDDFDKYLVNKFLDQMLTIDNLHKYRKSFIDTIARINNDRIPKAKCLLVLRARIDEREPFLLKEMFYAHFYGDNNTDAECVKSNRNAFFSELLWVIHCLSLKNRCNDVLEDQFKSKNLCKECKYQLDGEKIKQLNFNSIKNLRETNSEINIFVSDILDEFYSICDGNIYYIWNSLINYVNETNCTFSNAFSIDTAIKTRFRKVWLGDSDDLEDIIEKYKYQDKHYNNYFYAFLEMLPLYLPDEVSISNKNTAIDLNLYRKIYVIVVKWMCSMINHKSDDGWVCPKLARLCLSSDINLFLDSNKEIVNAVYKLLSYEEFFYSVKGKSGTDRDFYQHHDINLQEAMIKFKVSPNIQCQGETVKAYKLHPFIEYVYSNRCVFIKNKEEL